MAKQVIVIEEAWQDINEASNYYEQISNVLRSRFENELILFLQKLEAGVISFRNYKRDYRRVNLSSFPFKIYYKETKNIIIVVALIHASRGSQFLKRRLY